MDTARKNVLVCKEKQRIVCETWLCDGSVTFRLTENGDFKPIHAAPIGMSDMARSFTNEGLTFELHTVPSHDFMEEAKKLLTT